MSKKFTDLPQAALPLDGTEILALVQEGVSKQVMASDLPAPDVFGFGDDWNWTTSGTELSFQFPALSGNWLVIDDDGVDGAIALGGDSVTLLTLQTAGVLDLQADLGVGLDGDVGEEGQVLTSGGPGVPATWEDQAGGSGGLTLSDHAESYEVVLADANTGIVNPTGNGANSYFIPSDDDVNFDRGTFLVFINGDNFKFVTVTIEDGQMRLCQDGSIVTSFAIGPGGAATVFRVFTVEFADWYVIGNQIS